MGNHVNLANVSLLQVLHIAMEQPSIQPVTPPIVASAEKSVVLVKYVKVASAPQVQDRHTAMETPSIHPMILRTVANVGKSVVLTSVVVAVDA